MEFDWNILRSGEQTIYRLRGLYEKYGYRRFKMSKFEEYDLYVQNKDFLISDSVITFTDTNGKLMALKPDVTLSIVKNTTDEPQSIQKVYYNENVYRISKGTQGFKEIMQVGLECFGDIDNFNICEVLTLACKSLKSISEKSVLDISHLGVITSVFDAFDDLPCNQSTSTPTIGLLFNLRFHSVTYHLLLEEISSMTSSPVRT